MSHAIQNRYIIVKSDESYVGIFPSEPRYEHIQCPSCSAIFPEPLTFCNRAAHSGSACMVDPPNIGRLEVVVAFHQFDSQTHKTQAAGSSGKT